MDYEPIAKPAPDEFAVRPNLDEYSGVSVGAPSCTLKPVWTNSSDALRR